MYPLTVPVGGKAQEAEAALVGAGRCVVVVPLELKEDVAVSNLLLPPWKGLRLLLGTAPKLALQGLGWSGMPHQVHPSPLHHSRSSRRE